MPPKRCSNRGPVRTRETDVKVCFDKGVKVGYVLSRRRQPPPQQPQRVPSPLPRLETITLREMAKYARQYKIPNYGSLRKADMITALRNAGYTN